MNENQSFYLIAEIGHNHQGDMRKAIELFKAAKDSGAHAVKLQKRDNKKLYTKDFYNKVYDHRNSYGETYGKHRDALEFGETEYKELKDLAKELKIDFFATPFDVWSLEFLEKIEMQSYKIASADLTNLPLHTEIAKLNKKIFLSTGGGNIEQVRKAKDNINKYHNDLSILHCTAAYPAPIEDMNLNVVKTYKNEFKDNTIGLSDHENGIDAAPIAYLLGARVFEKHFTLNRANKGTDHAFSLEPEGMKKLARNLSRIPLLLGSGEKKLLQNEIAPLSKMLKSIVASKNLNKDKIIELSDLDFKSPGGGLTPDMIDKVLGKKLKKNLEQEELILEKDLND